MTRNDLDDRTRQALLESDPAPTQFGSAERRRADHSLAWILDSDREPQGPSDLVRPKPRRMRRVALVGALAIVATLGILGAQLIGGGEPAYATWTATPHTPSAPQELVATNACRGSLLDSLQDTPESDPGGVTRRALRQSTAVLAEQRGDWTLVVLGDGLDASCVTQDKGGPTANSWESSAYRESLKLGPRDVFVTSGGTGGSRNNLLSVLIGFPGADVTGISVHTTEHGEVTATVANGHVAAWWPGPTGMSVSDPSLGTTVDATVTYSDGTSEERRLDLGPNPR